MYEKAIRTPMSAKGDIAKRLTALRERAGLTVQQVADGLSALRGETVSKTSYGHYEGGKFKQKAIPLGLAQELAEVLGAKGVPESDVLALAGLTSRLLSTPSREPQRSLDGRREPAELGPAEGGARVMMTEQENLPVYGYVAGAGDEDVFFIDQGHEMTRTLRPNILKGAIDAYAVDVYGDSMAPKYEPGNRLWVHPKRPYKPGDDVVVQLDGERAILKRYVRKTDKHLILRQFNPAREIKIEWKEVKQVDIVVGMLTVAT